MTLDNALRAYKFMNYKTAKRKMNKFKKDLKVKGVINPGDLISKSREISNKIKILI